MLLGNTFRSMMFKEFKGENGTIIIIGGSKIYTGAPIFCGKAALRSGSDLVYIFTEKEAVNSIKVLYEAIVLDFQFIPRILMKATACVIGPGLGDVSNENLKIIKQMIDFLDDKNVPFVIDGDGIHLYKNSFLRNIGIAILTPNHNEAKNLDVNINHICIYKGKTDNIICGLNEIFVSNKPSPKRCGGQGDILSGVLATALSINTNNLLDACLSACEMVRNTSYWTFLQFGCTMITSDIIDMLPKAFKQLSQASNN